MKLVSKISKIDGMECIALAKILQVSHNLYGLSVAFLVLVALAYTCLHKGYTHSVFQSGSTTVCIHMEALGSQGDITFSYCKKTQRVVRTTQMFGKICFILA